MAASALPAASPWWRRNAAYAAAWALCALFCVAVTHFTHYRVHDPDSLLYAAMADDLARRPVMSWCAAEWNGHWNRHGLFYEHPPGLLWAGAALVRLGVVPLQALYACNFVAWFGGLALLWSIGRRLGGRDLGHVAICTWALTPAFAQYLVRGNQEHPLCFAVLLGLYALVVARRAVSIFALWASALVLGIAIKGVAGLALLPIAAVYLCIYDTARARRVAVVAGAVAAALGGVGFDLWARQVTGASFWWHYLAGQVHHSVGAAHVAHKLGNVMYYVARPLWFGLPAVALLLVYAAKRPKASRPGGSAAVGLGLVVTAVFLLGFSLANRKADRYIFPVYPALALAAGSVLLRWPWARRHVARWHGVMPYALILLLMIAVVAKVYIGTHHHIAIRWWPGG